MKYIDLFTAEEIKAAKGRDADYIVEHVVTEEVMRRIDRVTGQENLRRYMAYRLQYLAEKHG